jgi:hypothetical protein
MKYFATAMLFTGFGPPAGMDPWETTLGLEMVHLPTVSKGKRRVGFEGTKLEDLNKAPVFFRPRLTVGLPADFSATISYAPPLDLFDARAALFAASLNRPLWETDSIRLGARVFAQYANVRGDFTCPAGEEGSGDFRMCSQPSRDTLRAFVHGVEVIASFRLDAIPGVMTDLVPYAGLSGQYMDLEFEVDSTRGPDGAFGRDNRVLYTDGYTWAATAGLSYPVTDRLELSGGFLYSPLSVRRPGQERRSETFLNSRVQVAYTF